MSRIARTSGYFQKCGFSRTELTAVFAHLFCKPVDSFAWSIS
ncbi:hypothetical protein [Pseudomonas amygdali]|nr:hypothetical protein [Pseudomonas amygdali]